MTDDVMERLMDVQPLPRGERIARMHEKKEQPLYQYWERLLQAGQVVGVLDNRFLDLANEDIPDLWRAYAAPLRKARDEARQARACVNKLLREVERLRVELQGFKNVCKLNQSLLGVLRAQNEELRACLDTAVKP